VSPGAKSVEASVYRDGFSVWKGSARVLGGEVNCMYHVTLRAP
jgi:hypothetical protein